MIRFSNHQVNVKLNVIRPLISVITTILINNLFYSGVSHLNQLKSTHTQATGNCDANERSNKKKSSESNEISASE